MNRKRQPQYDDPHNALETARAMVQRPDEAIIPSGREEPTTERSRPDMDDGTGSTLNTAQLSTPIWESSLLLLLRLVLAGLFLFSGAAKLGFLGSYGNSPLEFATAIRKFQIVHYDLIPYLAFILPWIEVIGGVLLLIGLSSRGAAFLLKMLLAAFTVGMLIVIARGIEIGSCGCFGGRLAEHFGVVGEFLEAPVGWTSILRNIILMGLCFVIVWRGPSVVSLDAIAASRRR